MKLGRFISFEGSEGCGKSTQINRLQARLTASGHQVEFTREPGGTPLGESIRHLLKFAPEGEGMHPEAELLLFTASRAQLVRESLLPKLENGVHILADRFLDSSVVSQGIARGLDVETVRAINHFAVGPCLPDITFVLDMDAQTAHERALAESEQRDRMESEALDFYETVRQGYLTLAKQETDRLVVIDASQTIDEIEAEIWNTLTNRFDGFSD